MRRSWIASTFGRTAATAILAGLLLSTPAFGAMPSDTCGEPALLAAGSYWQGFVDFWIGGLKKQNGIVLAAVGIGAVCLFIITRGKWTK